MNPTNKKLLILDKKTALVKAESWCAYQERAQQEVRDKLYEWGLHQNEVEELITELIITNFLNEERFAMSYVSGKFNIKKWGKIKIKQGLKLKKVPEQLMKKALNSIDGEKYIETLGDLAKKKSATLTEKDPYKRKYKLITYLFGKGYENDLILVALKANDLIS
jgi:regulatory protein